MSENNICTICGGYIGNATLALTTMSTATVPTVIFCPGHSTTDADLYRPPTIVHENDPSRELMLVPEGSSIFPSNVEALWEIARQVAERDSVFFDGDASYDKFLCPFCNGGQTFHDHVRKEPFPHSLTCIVTKAWELMEWRKAQPQITVRIAQHVEPEVPRD
jgi:hypothetical protein